MFFHFLPFAFLYKMLCKQGLQTHPVSTKNGTDKPFPFVFKTPNPSNAFQTWGGSDNIPFRRRKWAWEGSSLPERGAK